MRPQPKYATVITYIHIYIHTAFLPFLRKTFSTFLGVFQKKILEFGVLPHRLEYVHHEIILHSFLAEKFLKTFCIKPAIFER